MNINRETNEVSFQLDDRLLAKLELAFLITGESPDNAFEKWVNLVANNAARCSDFDNPRNFSSRTRRAPKTTDKKYFFMQSHDSTADQLSDTDEPSPEYLLASVRRWGQKQSGIPYDIIRSFFNNAYEDRPDHLIAYRDKMRWDFENWHPEKQGTPAFITNFRLMCSNAPHAYGKIFNYNPREGIVTLNHHISKEMRSMETLFRFKNDYETTPIQTLQSYLKGFSSLCWNVSAGKDYRGLMFLSKPYCAVTYEQYAYSMNPLPNCFVFTDYHTRGKENFGFKKLSAHVGESNVILHRDNRTKIYAYNIKELPSLSLPFHEEFADEEKPAEYGRVFIADIMIQSRSLGAIQTNLVYCVAQDSAFASDFLIPNGINISHIVRVSTDNSIVGNQPSGTFFRHIFTNLSTKFFLTDSRDSSEADPTSDKCSLTPIPSNKNEGIVMVPAQKWSKSGDVIWYSITSLQ